MSLSSKKDRRNYRRTVRKDRVTLVLRTSDTPHRENVYVDVIGWGQEEWADHDGYLLGSTWEPYGNGRIWNMLPNDPGIVDDLRRSGSSPKRRAASGPRVRQREAVGGVHRGALP